MKVIKSISLFLILKGLSLVSFANFTNDIYQSDASSGLSSINSVSSLEEVSESQHSLENNHNNLEETHVATMYVVVDESHTQVLIHPKSSDNNLKVKSYSLFPGSSEDNEPGSIAQGMAKITGADKEIEVNEDSRYVDSLLVLLSAAISWFKDDVSKGEITVQEYNDLTDYFLKTEVIASAPLSEKQYEQFQALITQLNNTYVNGEKTFNYGSNNCISFAVQVYDEITNKNLLSSSELSTIKLPNGKVSFPLLWFISEKNGNFFVLQKLWEFASESIKGDPRLEDVTGRMRNETFLIKSFFTLGIEGKRVLQKVKLDEACHLSVFKFAMGMPDCNCEVSSTPKKVYKIKPQHPLHQLKYYYLLEMEESCDESINSITKECKEKLLEDFGKVSLKKYLVESIN